MGEPGVTAPSWERIAALRPRLNPRVRIHRHHYRGQPWYIVQDRASTRYFRFGKGAYQFIALLDGTQTVQAVWDALPARTGPDAPTQEDLFALIARLREAELLVFDTPSDAAVLFSRWQRNRQRLWWNRLSRPLALRFPILDPESFLSAGVRLARPFFGAAGLLLWILVISVAGILAVVHWPELADHASRRLLDPGNLLVMLLAYLVIKALHELGHGFAVKVWGGEVHEMGVMLLVLMPVPYVDASAASAFPNKHRRMVVGAAGIMIETLLAAVGLFVWMAVEPGTLRDVAFNVALVGGVSTLLFNGNPLLRFDGYYVLSDAIEIPNLGPRATLYFAYLAKRYVLGLADAASPASAPGERGWFLVYGPASYLYRLGILLVIALYLIDLLLAVGVLLVVWTIGAQLIYPLIRQLRYVLTSAELSGRRARGVALLGGALLALGGAMHWVSVPSWTRADGFIRLPDHSSVRAGADGFIVQTLRVSGESVSSDELLFELDDPVLRARVEKLEWRQRELEVRRVRALSKDLVEAAVLKEQLAELKVEMQQAYTQLEKLFVASPSSGVFSLSRAQDLPGRFVRKGDLLGYVVDPSAALARVVVPQTRVDLVRRQTRRVELRLASRSEETFIVTIHREVPSATAELPSRILGTQGGGDISVDVSDAKGVRTIEPVFQFDLALPIRAHRGFVGDRVFVRFEHQNEPLTHQLFRLVRQLLLARLEF